VLTQEAEILKHIAQFKSYYANFREGDIYFCVGINNSGGTIRDKTVYIGTEVAATDLPDWSVYLVLHEFVHTQQWTQRHLKELLADSSKASSYPLLKGRRFEKSDIYIAWVLKLALNTTIFVSYKVYYPMDKKLFNRVLILDDLASLYLARLMMEETGIAKNITTFQTAKEGLDFVRVNCLDEHAAEEECPD
jgi:hypothetical protein